MRAAALGMVLLCLVSGCTKYGTNTIGMELIEIPAGKFIMGSPVGEKGRQANEEQVAVTLTKPFWLAKTEVTQGQWKKVMGTAPWKGKKNVQADKDGAVSYVSWDEANAFCAELTDLEQAAGKLKVGEPYRLPTDAEWEYACRAGTTTAYSFGEDESKLGEYAWFDGNAQNVKNEYAHAVGLKKPNPWGLHDMHGNVAEWCSDWYSKELKGGTDPVGPSLLYTSGPGRMHRGGGWEGPPVSCRSARREIDVYEGLMTRQEIAISLGSSDPGPDPPYRGSLLGFRVARSQLAQ